MKKLFLFLSPLVLTLMVGCGGNDNAPPPQPPQLQMNNAIDQQQLQSMFALAKETKSTCADSGANSLIPLLPFITRQPGNPGPGPGLLPSLPPISGGCSNSLINFILMYITMKGGRYANDYSTRPWFISQIGGIITRVGEKLGPLTRDTQEKLYQGGWGLVQRDIINQPQLQTVRPAMCSGAGQFGLPC